MYISKLQIRNHPYLKNLDLDFINKKTGEPYRVVAFVGENGCCKTTILDLIFNYNTTEYIINKISSVSSLFGEVPLTGVFLRQNSLFASSQSEIVKSISGKDILPITSDNYERNKNILSLIRNCSINKPEKGQKIIDEFEDEVLSNAYKEGKTKKVSCGGLALKQINGTESPIDISKLSSGQQEIILKINNLQKTPSGADFILFDEPETSLHPKWQKIIIGKLEEMISCDGETPQLFIATHSEKVLESLLKKEDTLIIRLSKDEEGIRATYLEELPMCLPITTFSEINYIIFGIESFDYHNMLVARLGVLIGSEDNSKAIDHYIKEHRLHDNQSFKKWETIIKEKKYVYHTLPIYIRHYYHHPKEGKSVSASELIYSIKILRGLIRNILDKK